MDLDSIFDTQPTPKVFTHYANVLHGSENTFICITLCNREIILDGRSIRFKTPSKHLWTTQREVVNCLYCNRNSTTLHLQKNRLHKLNLYRFASVRLDLGNH